MPTFLDNSFSGLRRGYEQLYGQQAERGVRPSGQLFRPSPVAQNPAMGAPVGANDDGTYSYEEYYRPSQDNVPVPQQPVVTRPSGYVPGQGLEYGAGTTGSTVIANAPTNRSAPQRTAFVPASVPTPTPQSDVVAHYPVPVPTPESDVVPVTTHPAVVTHPAVTHTAAAAPVVRTAQPATAQVNYWAGNPTMARVGPQVQQGPSPNIFQRAWQSLGHLFGAPHVANTTAGGPGSQGHPYYGTPFQYGTPEYAHYWDTHWGAHVPRATLVTPTAHNPEQGQTLSGNDGSDGSGAGLLSNGNPPNWFQNFMTNLFGPNYGKQPTEISQNPEVGQPLSAYDIPQGSVFATPESTYSQSLDQLGAAGQWPTGSTVVPGQYVMGPSVGDNPGEILATGADATATPGGGGSGMSGANMASSAIGAIGSGLSNIGSNIAKTKFTYNAPNIPLPAKAVFTPPTLAPNTNVSY